MCHGDVAKASQFAPPRFYFQPVRKSVLFSDAFVDESIRGQRYLLCCTLVQAQNIPTVRRQIESMRTKRRRIHFNSSSVAIKKDFINLLFNLPIKSLVLVGNVDHRTHWFEARRKVLGELIIELQQLGVERVIIESRGDDSDDVRTILSTRTKQSRLYFEHRLAKNEPVLWIPDAIAWCYGAGGFWASKIESLVEDVIMCVS